MNTKTTILSFLAAAMMACGGASNPPELNEHGPLAQSAPGIDSGTTPDPVPSATATVDPPNDDPPAVDAGTMPTSQPGAEPQPEASTPSPAADSSAPALDAGVSDPPDAVALVEAAPPVPDAGSAPDAPSLTLTQIVQCSPPDGTVYTASFDTTGNVQVSIDVNGTRCNAVYETATTSNLTTVDLVTCQGTSYGLFRGNFATIPAGGSMSAVNGVCTTTSY
jgi:hypothetical protein